MTILSQDKIGKLSFRIFHFEDYLYYFTWFEVIIIAENKVRIIFKQLIMMTSGYAKIVYIILIKMEYTKIVLTYFAQG
jgi:hypothetical protein